MPRLLKDKRIKIIGLDEMTEEYTELATVWAHYRSMSVREGFNCGADMSWNNVYFTFTKPNFPFDTYCEIEYKGVRYSIEGIDLYEDKDGSNIRVHARSRYYEST